MNRWRLPRNRHGLGIGSLVLILAVSGSVLAEVRNKSKEEARVSNDVKYLASDELEGRGVGTDGLDRAAEFIREEFSKAGLDVERIDGSPFQAFTMVTGSELGTENRLTLIGPDEQKIELELDADFRPMSFGGSGEFNAELVFCGYAIDDSDKEYNDFADIDLDGKVAIIMRRVPQQSNPHGPFAGPHGGISRHAELRTKVSNAFGKGAVAVLFVNDPYSSREMAENQDEAVRKALESVAEAAAKLDEVDPEAENSWNAARTALSESVRKLKEARESAEGIDTDPLMEFGYGGNGSDRTIPIFHITQDVINEALAAAEQPSLAEIEAEIDSDLQPRSFVLEGWTGDGTATVNRIRTEVKNVIGVLEGEGPLADETIVVGAHYDHVGYGGPNSLAPGSNEVHNGADDNASGTASLLELARRLAAREEKLNRRIVFIAFTAEELGLIGSAHYVKEPVFPLEKTIAMFNMDMVGRLRDDKLTVFGTGTSSRWEDLLKKLNETHEFEFSMKPEGFGPSDHASFYGKQIPVLHFFTGTHEDYHRPSDVWEKINAAGIVKITDLIEETIVQTAQTSEKPDYIEVKRPATIARSGNRPYFGSVPDFGGEGRGYGISGVAPGSPADKGGLKGGDRIVQMGEQKIDSLDDFDLALRKFSAGDEVKVVVLRDGEEVELNVTLDKPR